MTAFSQPRVIANDAVSASNSMPQRFVATRAWNSARPQTLVVCCSDGRWHTQVEEFIRARGLERADLFAVPGGPAGLSVWSSSFDESRVAEKSLRFLAEHHDLQAVWLIAHADCAYYRQKFQPHDSKFILGRQLEDLRRAADTIHRWYPAIAVQLVFAKRHAEQVVFETLAFEPAS